MIMTFFARTAGSTVRSVAVGIVGAALSLTSLSTLAFKEPGKIIAGSDITFFPYEYMENNKPKGFDIEFLEGLGKVMGREAINIDTRWANLIPGLRGGRFDITNSSMYITADRMKVIDMIPYLKSGESILSIKGSDYQPEMPEDFCGHRIGSMAGTAWLKQLQTLSVEYCEANGLKPIAISEYPTDPQTTQAMLSHAVEAQITDAAVARGVVEKLGGRVVISSRTLIYPVLNGFGVKKGNDIVRNALIAGIEKFSKTPEYAALLKKYNFQAPTAADIESLLPKK
ncbi:transporter substrate-binding domain-containing protein [Oceanobacter sp. 4_MG-2023]|nr:transporter substrate-binding domain-containing protein [Oceanobacter sp. 4_MG-2023]